MEGADGPGTEVRQPEAAEAETAVPGLLGGLRQSRSIKQDLQKVRKVCCRHV